MKRIRTPKLSELKRHLKNIGYRPYSARAYEQYGGVLCLVCVVPKGYKLSKAETTVAHFVSNGKVPMITKPVAVYCKTDSHYDDLTAALADLDAARESFDDWRMPDQI